MANIKAIIRKVFSVRKHWIMRLKIDGADQNMVCDNICLYKVKDNNKELIEGTYSCDLQRKIISNNQGKCDTFILFDDNRAIGILSVMYRDGNELEYKIRNIDAFVYNVYVQPEYRGKGYAGQMINLLKKVMLSKSIQEIYLAVSKDNTSAIKAYEKVGFDIIGKKNFVRLLKHNIPYHSL